MDQHGTYLFIPLEAHTFFVRENNRHFFLFETMFNGMGTDGLSQCFIRSMTGIFSQSHFYMTWACPYILNIILNFCRNFSAPSDRQSFPAVRNDSERLTLRKHRSDFAFCVGTTQNLELKSCKHSFDKIAISLNLSLSALHCNRSCI